MIKNILLSFMFVLWLYSYYLHFKSSFRRQTMVAFCNPTDSLRSFFKTFDATGVDLWATRRSKRRLGVYIGYTSNPFKIFKTYSYEHMLLVDKVTSIPHVSQDVVVEYVKHNDTVASYWPRLKRWPSRLTSSKAALSWYSGPTITVNL